MLDKLFYEIHIKNLKSIDKQKYEIDKNIYKNYFNETKIKT